MLKITSKILKIQQELPSFDKDAKNPHFKSSFTSLPNVLSKALPVLMANKVLLTNHSIHNEFGNYVRVQLTDVESGESIHTDVPMIKIDSMQLVGQAFTYAQRYGFLSLIGQCADLDVDAEDLEGRGKTGEAAAARAKKAAEAKPKEPAKPNPKAEAIAVIKNLLPNLWDSVAEDKIKWLTDVSEGKVDPSESGAVGGAKYLQSLVA